MKDSKNDLRFYIGLAFAIWFACTALFWTYFAALFFSYPFGIISYFLWRSIKNEDKRRTKIIPIILIFGVGLSFVVLVSLLISG